MTGTGTRWNSQVLAGEGFLGPDELLYEILSISSDTELVLRLPYAGPSMAGGTYAVIPTQSYTKALAAQVSELLVMYQNAPAEATEVAVVEAVAQAVAEAQTVINAAQGTLDSKVSTAQAAAGTATAASNAAQLASAAALAAGVIFDTINLALTSTAPVIAVDAAFWVRPNVTDGLARMTVFKRTGTGTTSADYVLAQSLNSGAEFDGLANRFLGDFSTLDPARYRRCGHAYAIVGSDRRLIERRSTLFQRDLLGPLRVPSINGVEYLDTGRWARSGVRRAIIGSDRRKIETETATGISFDKPLLAPNLQEPITSQRWARSGKPKATIGTDRRLLANAATPATVVPTSPALTDLYVAYSDDDGTGKQAVYAEQRKTGRRLKLSSAGANNTNPRIEGDAVIWSSDRANAAPSALYWSRPDAANEHPVRPLRSLACFGDSLTAMNWMEFLPANGITVPAYNFGRSADTSLAIASRYGAYESLYTVAGGSIPASGPVTVVNVGKGNVVSKFANVAASTVVWLNGVFGTLSFDGDSTTTFTRMTSGSAVPSPGSVRCVWAPSPSGDPASEAGLITNNDDMVLIAFMGRNNTVPVQFILNDFQAMYDRIATRTRRFVFIPYLPATGSGEIIGTGAYKNRQELVAGMFARWPDNTLDLLPAMQAAYNPALPQDVADVANGVTPSSLMRVDAVPADYVHPNDAGRAVEAAAIATFLTSKGFLQ
ncbi:hypothetical protein [Variovorax paradoxus]|uniref:hypothetical protein n=1 Tax=Variovorax paradoxus TaxID=34073 RepID=UPI0029C8B990|nr:hypothetical protein [Variovorax paradoxus]WPH18236.1 hypothetical protein RZE78_14460 [Variovorax paradoxus]